MALDIGGFFQNLYDKYIASKPAENVQPENFTPVDANLNPVNFTPYDLSQQSQFTPVDENLQPLNFTPVDMSLNPLNFTPVNPTTLEPLNFTPVDNNLNPINFTPVNPETLQPNNFTPYDLGKLSGITQVDGNLNPVNFTPYDLNLNTEEIQNFTPFNTAPITPPSQDNGFIDTLRNIAPAIGAEMLIPGGAALAGGFELGKIAIDTYFPEVEKEELSNEENDVLNLLNNEKKSVPEYVSNLGYAIGDITGITDTKNSIANELGGFNVKDLAGNFVPESTIGKLTAATFPLVGGLVSGTYGVLKDIFYDIRNDENVIINNNFVEKAIENSTGYSGYAESIITENLKRTSNGLSPIKSLQKEQYDRVVSSSKGNYDRIIQGKKIDENKKKVIESYTTKEGFQNLTKTNLELANKGIEGKITNLISLNNYGDVGIQQAKQFFVGTLQQTTEELEQTRSSFAETLAKSQINQSEFYKNSGTSDYVKENYGKVNDIVNKYPLRSGKIFELNLENKFDEKNIRELIKKEHGIDVPGGRVTFLSPEPIPYSLGDLVNIYYTGQDPNSTIIESPKEYVEGLSQVSLASYNVNSGKIIKDFFRGRPVEGILSGITTVAESATPSTRYIKLGFDSTVDTILNPVVGLASAGISYLTSGDFKNFYKRAGLAADTSIDEIYNLQSIDIMKGGKYTPYKDYYMNLTDISGNAIGFGAEILALGGTSGLKGGLTAGQQGLKISSVAKRIQRIAGIGDLKKIEQGLYLGSKSLNYTWNAFKTEGLIESVIAPYDNQLGSDLSRAFSKYGLLFGTTLELAAPALRFGNRLVTGTDTSRLAIDIAKDFALNTSGEGKILYDTMQELEKTAREIHRIGKSLGNSEQVDSVLKNIMADGVYKKDVVDKAIKDGILSKSISQASLRGDKAAQASIDSIFANINPDSVKLYEELKRVANDGSVSVKDLMYNYTGKKIDVPYTTTITESSGTVNNGFSIKKSLLDRFESIGGFGTLNRYTKKQLDSLGNIPLLLKENNEYKYRVKQDDGKYSIDWFNVGEEQGVYKDLITNDLLKKSLAKGEKIDNIVINLNNKKQIFENVDELVSNGAFEKLDAFLSKIFC